MLVDFVGQLNRKYLATAFSSLNGSPTSYNRESAKLIVLSTWKNIHLGSEFRYCKILIIWWQFINNKQNVKDANISHYSQELSFYNMQKIHNPGI